MRLVLAVSVAEIRLRSRFPRLVWGLTPDARELRCIQSELRRLECDPEFAAEWRAELAEGWRRVEFDQALLRALEGLPDGGGPS
ncbi:hypothetical protein [Streptomyces sp. NPDC020965]|uniref:hypothetical protein n=1 Tax=Streptomyces sp. NPDC020965 TaxID=3365105 RepID=UPI0037B6A4E9